MSFSRAAFILSVHASERTIIVTLNCNFADCEKVCPLGSDTFLTCSKYLLFFNPFKACFECIISNLYVVLLLLIICHRVSDFNCCHNVFSGSVLSKERNICSNIE